MGPEEAQLNSGRIWKQSFESQLYIKIVCGYSYFQGLEVLQVLFKNDKTTKQLNYHQLT